MMLRFILHTPADAVSEGEQTAEGVQFSDGTVVLRMLGKTPPVIIHQTLDAMLHRHALAPACVRWMDQPR